MVRLATIGIALLAGMGWAADVPDPCAATSSTPDVQFSIAVRDRAVFQAGEIIPLVLTFSSSAKDKYIVEDRNYDRSGRLDTEHYCVDPEAPDPLAAYRQLVWTIGGGLFGRKTLDSHPFTAQAELNEWFSLRPGHYRVWAVSERVLQMERPAVRERIRSNTIEIDVKPPDPAWQGQQLRRAIETLAHPSSPEEGRRAARQMRFLNTPDSTRQLARQFWTLYGELATLGFELMFGLVGSPYRQLAIEAMRAEISAPEHGITEDFLTTLVNLELTANFTGDPPAAGGLSFQEAMAFWKSRGVNRLDMMKDEMQRVIAALPRKNVRARAISLAGLVMVEVGDDSPAKSVVPALIDAWPDLPAPYQRRLIESRWLLLAGPRMVPILKQIAAQPPPAHTVDWMTQSQYREIALEHLAELTAGPGH